MTLLTFIRPKTLLLTLHHSSALQTSDFVLAVLTKMHNAYLTYLVRMSFQSEPPLLPITRLQSPNSTWALILLYSFEMHHLSLVYFHKEFYHTGHFATIKILYTFSRR
jgi:hypothetical protein